MEFTKRDNNNDAEQTPCLNWIERTELISLLIHKKIFLHQNILVLKGVIS